MIKLNDILYLVDTTLKYIDNRGKLVYEACNHMSWDAENSVAKNLFVKGKDGVICSHCGHMDTDNMHKRVDKLVDYLNAGGRNERKLRRLSGRIEVDEWAVGGPGIVVDCFAKAKLTAKDLSKSFGKSIHPVIRFGSKEK